MSGGLTRKQLDAMTCGGPGGCDHTAGGGHEMYFHARCHMEAGTEASYKDGVITMSCAQCGLFIADIKVAES